MQRRRFYADKNPVYLNVLQLQFTREASTATGEMLVSAKPAVVNLVEAVGTSTSVIGAADDSESEG